MPLPDLDAEWLEADGLGGFATGTVAGGRTRRYHGLLTPAIAVPSRRAVLVDGCEAWLEVGGSRRPLSTQYYLPDVVHPAGRDQLVGFSHAPWPCWTWRLEGGIEVRQELVIPHERPTVIIRWTVLGAPEGSRLIVRPLLSGRDTHALHHENDTIATGADVSGDQVRWHTYEGYPAVLSLAAARYQHDPLWYRDFLLAEEQNRGFEHRMDLFSPGELSFDLPHGEAIWMLMAEGAEGHVAPGRSGATALARRLIARESIRRAAFPDLLAQSGDAYLVRRSSGKTIIAGYPWFTDWGRDTFIALRGLCLATGRLDDARAILLEWAGQVREGMLPNRFVEGGDAPEFNAVDASLWFIIAVHEYLMARAATGKRVVAAERRRLGDAVEAILSGYSAGTRYGIHLDGDGLLAAGVPGVQLTWMDAKVGDWVVTPRVGKPVEIQALWINALQIGATFSDRWARHAGRATAAFQQRFWHPDGYLYDVVDVDGISGMNDASFRPNQLFALGGLPFPVIELERGRELLAAVEARLWTPMGPRSLSPGEPGYHPHYTGGPLERDGAYHQGTVWPWLAGAFIEAWVRVNGDTDQTRERARRTWFTPLLEGLTRAGLGHLAEIADAEAPFTPRGCPFQAWSMGELLRLDRIVLAARAPVGRARPGKQTSAAR